MKIYFNGYNEANLSHSTNSEQNANVNFLSFNSATLDFDGLIDEVGIWNKTLSDAEILELYNSGSGYQYPFSNPNINFTITAYDAVNSSQLLNFTAALNGTYYSTDTGTITTPYLLSESQIFEINFSTPGYVNQSYPIVNSSQSFQGNLTPTFRINATDLHNGSIILTFNATIDSIYYNTTTGQIVTEIDPGNLYNITLESYAYAVYSNEINTTNNLIANLTPFLRINASDYHNSSIIQTFNATIGAVTYNTTTGEILTDIERQNATLYNATFNTPGYVSRSYFGINATNNLNISLYVSLLNLLIRDDYTSEYLDSFTLNNSEIQHTTTTGLIQAPLNTTSYTFNASTYGYESEEFSFTISAAETLNYTLNLTGIYINFSLMDEVTLNLFNVSVPESVDLTIYCNDTTQNYTFSQDSNASILISCPYTLMKLDVIYNGSSYFRSLIPGYDDRNITFWLPDATTATVIQIITRLMDLTGDYSDAVIYVKKTLTGFGSVDMITQRFDIEGKAILYLIQNHLYTVSLRDDNHNIRSLGYFVADAAGEKTITVPDVEYNPGGVLGDSLIFYPNLTDDALRFYYTDTSGSLTDLTFTIYNASNDSQVLYTTTSNDVATATFSYIPAANQSYIICLSGSHAAEGTINDCRPYGPDIESDTGISATTKNTLSIIFIIILSVFVGNYTPTGSLLLTTLLSIILIKFGWLDFGSAYLNSAVFALIGVLTAIEYFLEANRK